MDTRFSFCAVAALSLLNRLQSIDVHKATQFVISCMNFDGGFGCRPGSETHSGQVKCEMSCMRKERMPVYRYEIQYIGIIDINVYNSNILYFLPIY